MTASSATGASPLLYLATSTYLTDRDQVAAAVPDHRAWIVDLYRSGVMLASGPQPSGVGGVLVFRADDDDAARAVVDDDPLARRRLADYRLTAFRPTPMPHRSDAVEAFLGLRTGATPLNPPAQHPEGAES